MRRLLRDIAEGHKVEGDITTLEDEATIHVAEDKRV